MSKHDQNEVISSLKICVCSNRCDGCSYNDGDLFCKRNLLIDIYDLLKAILKEESKDE